jgi:hypothetical protein
LLSIVNYIARALRWALFQRRLGIRLAAGRTLLYYVAGFAMLISPGRIGEALRLWFLQHGHGYRYDRTTAMLIGDRLAMRLQWLCSASPA